MGHRAEGEHYERQCRPGGVEAVGPVHDHPHAAVERFVTGVIDAQADGSQYALPVLADRLRERYEGPEPAPGRA